MGMLIRRTQYVARSFSSGTKEVLLKDKFGYDCSLISPQEHEKNVVRMNDMMETYYEFPALFMDCPSKREAILGSDPANLAKFGLPGVAFDIWNYGSLYPAFIELKLPLAEPAAPKAAVTPPLPALVPAAAEQAASVPPSPAPEEVASVNVSVAEKMPASEEVASEKASIPKKIAAPDEVGSVNASIAEKLVGVMPSPRGDQLWR